MFFVVVPPAVSARPDFTYAADKERGGDADPFWSCTRPQKGEKACPPVSYKVRSIHGCRLLHTCFEKAVVRFAIERRPDTPAARSAHRSPDGRRAASAPCPSAGGRSCLSCPFNACAVSTAAAPTRPGLASPTSAAATPGPSSVTSWKSPGARARTQAGTPVLWLGEVLRQKAKRPLLRPAPARFRTAGRINLDAPARR